MPRFDRIDRRSLRMPVAASQYREYAESAARRAFELAGSQQATVHVGDLIGRLRLPGIRDITIKSNPWRRATLEGLSFAEAPSLAFDAARYIEAFTSDTIKVVPPGAVPASGKKMLIEYRNATTNDNVPTDGAFESPGGGPTGRRRCYGELVEVVAYDSSTRIATLLEPLARTYQIPTPAQPKSLRLWDISSTVCKGVAVEGIDVVVPAYGRVAGFQNQGVAVYQCIDLTLRDIRVKGALGQGIMVSTCRHVLVEGCEVEMAPFSRIGGLLYGVEIQFSHYVTLQDHTTIFARYGCTVSRGSTHVTVQRLLSKSIHPTGATADIHGGDCKDITFRDFETVTRGLTLGNTTWTRGANGVTVENITGVGVGFVGSIRNATVTDCSGAAMIFLDANVDTGNGFNNSTGANQGYSSGVSVNGGTFDLGSPIDTIVLPLTFSHVSAGAPIGLRDIQFQGVNWVNRSGTNSVMRMQRPHLASFVGNVSFTNCTFTFFWARLRLSATF